MREWRDCFPSEELVPDHLIRAFGVQGRGVHNLSNVECLLCDARVIHDFRGTEKRRLRAEDLLARFEEVRRAEQLDETVAEMLRRSYV